MVEANIVHRFATMALCVAIAIAEFNGAQDETINSWGFSGGGGPIDALMNDREVSITERFRKDGGMFDKTTTCTENGCRVEGKTRVRTVRTDIRQFGIQVSPQEHTTTHSRFEETSKKTTARPNSDDGTVITEVTEVHIEGGSTTRVDRDWGTSFANDPELKTVKKFTIEKRDESKPLPPPATLSAGEQALLVVSGMSNYFMEVARNAIASPTFRSVVRYGSEERSTEFVTTSMTDTVEASIDGHTQTKHAEKFEKGVEFRVTTQTSSIQLEGPGNEKGPTATASQQTYSWASTPLEETTEINAQVSAMEFIQSERQGRILEKILHSRDVHGVTLKADDQDSKDTPLRSMTFKASEIRGGTALCTGDIEIDIIKVRYASYAELHPKGITAVGTVQPLETRCRCVNNAAKTTILHPQTKEPVGTVPSMNQTVFDCDLLGNLSVVTASEVHPEPKQLDLPLAPKRIPSPEANRAAYGTRISNDMYYEDCYAFFCNDLNGYVGYVTFAGKVVYQTNWDHPNRNPFGWIVERQMNEWLDAHVRRAQEADERRFKENDAAHRRQVESLRQQYEDARNKRTAAQRPLRDSVDKQVKAVDPKQWSFAEVELQRGPRASQDVISEHNFTNAKPVRTALTDGTVVLTTDLHILQQLVVQSDEANHMFDSTQYTHSLWQDRNEFYPTTSGHVTAHWWWFYTSCYEIETTRAESLIHSTFSNFSQVGDATVKHSMRDTDVEDVEVGPFSITVRKHRVINVTSEDPDEVKDRVGDHETFHFSNNATSIISAAVAAHGTVIVLRVLVDRQLTVVHVGTFALHGLLSAVDASFAIALRARVQYGVIPADASFLSALILAFVVSNMRVVPLRQSTPRGLLSRIALFTLSFIVVASKYATLAPDTWWLQNPIVGEVLLTTLLHAEPVYDNAAPLFLLLTMSTTSLLAMVHVAPLLRNLVLFATGGSETWWFPAFAAAYSAGVGFLFHRTWFASDFARGMLSLFVVLPVAFSLHLATGAA